MSDGGRAKRLLSAACIIMGMSVRLSVFFVRLEYAGDTSVGFRAVYFCTQKLDRFRSPGLPCYYLLSGPQMPIFDASVSKCKCHIGID